MKIAIVGGGSSGLTALGQLVQRLIAEPSFKPCEILFFEKDVEKIATGMPYRTDSSSVWLLNGPPANEFKLLPDGETLAEWMRENYQSWKEKFPNVDADDLYPPRALIGHYFKDNYERIKKQAAEHGIVIQEKIQEVVNVQSSDSGFEIMSKEKPSEKVDKVLLCFGHLPSDNFQELKGKKNYLSSAWDAEGMKTIPSDETVYIIGGHLSFIDAAKELVMTDNFQGKFVMVTRHPTLITIRGSEVSKDYNQTPIKSMEKELKSHKKGTLDYAGFDHMFWSYYEKSTQEPIGKSFLQKKYRSEQVLSYQLAKKNDNQSLGNINELRVFMEKFCLGGCYSALWDALNATGKQDYKNHFYSFMVAVMAGIPEINARFLVEMYNNKRIEELTELTSIQYDERKELFVLQFADGSKREAKYVINATGTGRDIRKHLDENPLLDNLVKNKIIEPSEWGGYTVKEPGLVSINPSNYFEGKPGLSAVFLACENAQKWIDGILTSEAASSEKPSCF